MVTGRQGQFFELEFERPVLDVLEAFGRVPLLPTSRRAARIRPSRYQTVYAAYPGRRGRSRRPAFTSPRIFFGRLAARG